MAHTAILDACVLYPFTLRDFFVSLAGTGLYRAKWTEAIQNEWIRSVLENRPDLSADRFRRTAALMADAVPDAMVAGYEYLIESIELPDPNDRHVVAAAIHSRCDVIVTINLRDFPPETMSTYGVQVQHPDIFAEHLMGIDAAKVVASVKRQRERLARPPVRADEFLDRLESLGLTRTVSLLRPYAAVI